MSNLTIHTREGYKYPSRKIGVDTLTVAKIINAVIEDEKVKITIEGDFPTKPDVNTMSIQYVCALSNQKEKGKFPGMNTYDDGHFGWPYYAYGIDKQTVTSNGNNYTVTFEINLRDVIYDYYTKGVTSYSAALERVKEDVYIEQIALVTVQIFNKDNINLTTIGEEHKDKLWFSTQKDSYGGWPVITLTQTHSSTFEDYPRVGLTADLEKAHVTNYPVNSNMSLYFENFNDFKAEVIKTRGATSKDDIIDNGESLTFYSSKNKTEKSESGFYSFEDWDDYKTVRLTFPKLCGHTDTTDTDTTETTLLSSITKDYPVPRAFFPEGTVDIWPYNNKKIPYETYKSTYSGQAHYTSIKWGTGYPYASYTETVKSVQLTRESNIRVNSFSFLGKTTIQLKGINKKLMDVQLSYHRQGATHFYEGRNTKPLFTFDLNPLGNTLHFRKSGAEIQYVSLGEIEYQLVDVNGENPVPLYKKMFLFDRADDSSPDYNASTVEEILNKFGVKKGFFTPVLHFKKTGKIMGYKDIQVTHVSFPGVYYNLPRNAWDWYYLDLTTEPVSKVFAYIPDYITPTEAKDYGVPYETSEVKYIYDLKEKIYREVVKGETATHLKYNLHIDLGTQITCIRRLGKETLGWDKIYCNHGDILKEHSARKNSEWKVKAYYLGKTASRANDKRIWENITIGYTVEDKTSTEYTMYIDAIRKRGRTIFSSAIPEFLTLEEAKRYNVYSPDLIPNYILNKYGEYQKITQGTGTHIKYTGDLTYFEQEFKGLPVECKILVQRADPDQFKSSMTYSRKNKYFFLKSGFTDLGGNKNNNTPYLTTYNGTNIKQFPAGIAHNLSGNEEDGKEYLDLTIECGDLKRKNESGQWVNTGYKIRISSGNYGFINGNFPNGDILISDFKPSLSLLNITKNNSNFTYNYCNCFVIMNGSGQEIIELPKGNYQATFKITTKNPYLEGSKTSPKVLKTVVLNIRIGIQTVAVRHQGIGINGEPNWNDAFCVYPGEDLESNGTPTRRAARFYNQAKNQCFYVDLENMSIGFGRIGTYTDPVTDQEKTGWGFWNLYGTGHKTNNEIGAENYKISVKDANGNSVSCPLNSFSS